MCTRAEPHKSFTMENNIVYFDQGDLPAYNGMSGSFSMRNNLYYDTRGTNMLFAGEPFTQWKASGHDQGSIIADPLFVNASNFDFRLRSESPALKLGLRQMDMTTVGPRVRAGADAW